MGEEREREKEREGKREYIKINELNDTFCARASSAYPIGHKNGRGVMTVAGQTVIRHDDVPQDGSHVSQQQCHEEADVKADTMLTSKRTE